MYKNRPPIMWTRSSARQKHVINDGLHIIYVNAQINDGTDISELMIYFIKGNGSDPKFPVLSEKVTELKEIEGGI